MSKSKKTAKHNKATRQFNSAEKSIMAERRAANSMRQRNAWKLVYHMKQIFNILADEYR